MDNPYRVVEKNAAETVALVEGEPGDALPIATVTLGNLQAFVDRLAGIAKPEDEIDLYLDFYVILGIPAGRAEELNRWLFETVIPSCPLRSDVLDMINAGRGIENLAQTEKLFLAFVFGRVSMIRPPGMGVLFGGRVP